jgi:hypothetical protein
MVMVELVPPEKLYEDFEIDFSQQQFVKALDEPAWASHINKKSML